MSDPIPVNLGAIEARQTQRLAKEALARQVSSEDRFEEAVDVAFNPGAVEREQARFNRFRPLQHRAKNPETEGKKIKEVDQKAEEDLSQQYQNRNPELPADRLRRLRESLSRTATPQEIIRQVTRDFPDSTLADEAMEYLERATEGEDLQATIRAARALFNEEKGREIIAGRNVSAVANLYYTKGAASSPTELRDLYRDVTGNPRDHNALFTELSEKYPFDNLKLVVAFLLKGMGYDLKSKGPSIQQAELVRLMSDVRTLQSILWVYLFFKGRFKLIKKLFDKNGLLLPKGLDFEKLSKEFIKLVEERYPSIMKLLKHAEKMGLLEEAAKIIVLSQYRDAMRQLSNRLYKSHKQRQDLLLVILETLEELEEKEEDEEKA